jgi:hypothetical protein
MIMLMAEITFIITLVSCFHNWFHKYGTNSKLVTMNQGLSEILNWTGITECY